MSLQVLPSKQKWLLDPTGSNQELLFEKSEIHNAV
jgi:hypothetical protein